MSLKHLHPSAKLPARTVVIGAGGFVGGAIARRVEKAGGAVLAVMRGDVNLMAPDAAQRLGALLKPDDAVVAAAAWAPCKDLAMLIDNMVMAKAMIDAIRGVAVSHVINISSDAVYADGPLPLTEDSPAAPTSMHGAMHLARELAFASELKAPIAMLRPTLIYGASDPHNGYGPNRFRRLANAGEEIVLFGEGEERRDHVLIDDLAELALRVLSHRSQGTLNIVTGTVISFRSAAEQVVAAAPNKVAISGRPRSGPMPHNGYRPFDPKAVAMAFPDFKFTDFVAGIARVQAEERR
jgi:nucleoside-diphosphate-sugar epimerase